MKKVTWNDTKDIDSLAEILQTGAVIGGTTDTVIGLFAPLTRAGFEKLNTIKGRLDKPYIVLVSDLQKAMRLSEDFEKPEVKKIADAYWPGPLTLIVNAHESLPEHIRSGKGTIAIRIPDHKGVQNLLRYFDGLFSTSANLAGGSIPKTIDAIKPEVLDHLDAVVSDDISKTVPSTIIDATGDKIKLVREGAVDVSKLVS